MTKAQERFETWFVNIGQCMAVASLVYVPLLMVGCNHHDDPPKPFVDNDAQNAVTDRQHLVRDFHTAEVMLLPYHDKNVFIVRDTNGCIWYVNTDHSGGYMGMTRLFDQFAPSPTNRVVMDEVMGVAEIQAEQATGAMNAFIHLAVEASRQGQTNIYEATNIYAHFPPKMAQSIQSLIDRHIKEYMRTNTAEDPTPHSK